MNIPYQPKISILIGGNAIYATKIPTTINVMENLLNFLPMFSSPFILSISPKKALLLLEVKHPLVEQASYKSQLSSGLFLFFLSKKYFQRWYVDQNKAGDISIKNGET